MRPAVTIAYAQSLNGTIARERGEPTKISCPESDTFTHQLRGLHDGIAVGVGTIIADDPRLNCRDGSGSSPLPVIFDTNLRTPPTARVFGEHPQVALLCSSEAERLRSNRYDQSITRFLPILGSKEGDVLYAALEDIREKLGILSLMVEGGAALIRSFLESRLFDLLAVTLSPRVLGGYQIGGVPEIDVSLQVEEWTLLGNDLLLIARRNCDDG